MADPFIPVYKDGQSGARLLSDLVGSRPFGHLLTFEEIADQLGIGASELVRIRGVVARAKRVVLREHKKALQAVPGEGYKILNPNEHAGLAVHHRKKSDRQIRKAISVIKGTDEERLTDVERARHHHLGMVLTNLHERQLDVESRVSKLEALMRDGGSRGPAVIPGEVMENARAIEATTDEELTEAEDSG